jgi:hypothetical protein
MTNLLGRSAEEEPIEEKDIRVVVLAEWQA